MRIQCDFMYMTLGGKRGLFDAAGNPVSLDNLLKQFKPTEGNPVPVRIIADDGRSQTATPFDIATAKLIVGQRKKAYFCLEDGRKVTVYNVSAAGRYPVIGMDTAGRPCLWDRNGLPENGDESLRLWIQEEVDPSAAPVEEEEHAPVVEEPEPETQETGPSDDPKPQGGGSVLDEFLEEE